MSEKTCGWCEKPVRDRRAFALYCSVACRLEAQKERRRERTRAAREAEREQERQFLRSVWPNDSEERIERALEKWISGAPCEYCGRGFRLRRKHARFCSAKCKQAEWRVWNSPFDTLKRLVLPDPSKPLTVSDKRKRAFRVAVGRSKPDPSGSE